MVPRMRMLLTAALATVPFLSVGSDSQMQVTTQIGKTEGHIKINLVSSGGDDTITTASELLIYVKGAPAFRLQGPAITVYSEDMGSKTYQGNYETIADNRTEAAHAQIVVGDAKFTFADIWNVTSNTLTLKRKLIVSGNAAGGFVSSLMVERNAAASLGDIRFFAPGTMYGAPEHIDPKAAGGMEAYQAGALEIREDMLPAPLFGLWPGDGTSLAMLHLDPRGNSTLADFDKPLEPQTSEQFRFGAFGAREKTSGRVEFGYWFPGTRGHLNEVHRTTTGSASHLRYHPIKDGLSQEYSIAFRFGEDESFHDFFTSAWRWAWDELKPKVDYHNIDQVRRSLIDMTAEQVETHGGRSGLPNSINMKNTPRTRDPKAVIGFTGKNLEAAVFMLMDAARGESPKDGEHREKALAIIESFLKLKVAPPEGEGFDMETGELRLALPHDKVIYLRSFTDDMKILLRGYEFEKARGIDHPEWLAWCRDFADWLLTQQQPSGGFPRAWEPGTGKVAVDAPQSSYNPVPMLVHLTKLTGNQKYLEAAERAAELCWITEQAQDHFVGGTIDNPNIIDKEAATLSVEAYLALFEQLGEAKWLDRAAAAADHAETYIYIWDVPMPDDAAPGDLHWVKGVSTIGLNVVSTSRPGLADSFMAFDVDELAHLYKLTGDEHYLDVATLLLHNSSNMVAVPGRQLNMPGPGWASEHIGLGLPHRGRGLNRLWLPWVATCRLNGIFFLEQLDPELFEQMKQQPQ